MKCITNKLALSGVICVVVCFGLSSISEGGEYTYTELLPPGWSSAEARSININGDVVGSGENAGIKGFLYSEGVYTLILPPGFIYSSATGINDTGTVVGWCDDGSDDGTAFHKGFLCSGGAYTEIIPPGWLGAEAQSINNSGTVVGYGQDSTGLSKGFIYSGGVYTEIIPPGWIHSYATDINDSGTVVGYWDDGTGLSKGFIYNEGVYTEILLPTGWGSPIFNAINNSGVLVGVVYDGTGEQKGFIAIPQSTLIMLNTFIATPKAGKIILQWSTASEIDNAGFNLYRANSENGDYLKINTSLIPAQGSSAQGANYEFIDKDVQNRRTYYYKLEDIDLNGNPTMHGPVKATPRWICGVVKQQFK